MNTKPDATPLTAASGEAQTPQHPLARASQNVNKPEIKKGAPFGNKNARRLNPKVKQVISLLLTNPDISVEAACAEAQCVRRTFYKAEQSEAYATYIASLGRTRLRTRILAKAMHRYERLIDADSEYVAADISKDALAQAGVRDRFDGSRRSPAAGSITIIIGSEPLANIIGSEPLANGENRASR